MIVILGVMIAYGLFLVWALASIIVTIIREHLVSVENERKLLGTKRSSQPSQPTDSKQRADFEEWVMCEPCAECLEHGWHWVTFSGDLNAYRESCLVPGIVQYGDGRFVWTYPDEKQDKILVRNGLLQKILRRPNPRKRSVPELKRRPIWK